MAVPHKLKPCAIGMLVAGISYLANITTWLAGENSAKHYRKTHLESCSQNAIISKSIFMPALETEPLEKHFPTNHPMEET